MNDENFLAKHETRYITVIALALNASSDEEAEAEALAAASLLKDKYEVEDRVNLYRPQKALGQ